MKALKVLYILNSDTETSLVLLIDLEDKKVLPIYTGKCEGNSIYLNAIQTKTPRPLTYQLMNSLVTGLRSKVKEVRIDKIKNSTYFATVVIQNGIEELEVDSRTSDAIALALVSDVPILVDDSVIDSVGVPIEIDSDLLTRYLRKAGNSLVNEIEKNKKAKGEDLVRLSQSFTQESIKSKQQLISDIVHMILS